MKHDDMMVGAFSHSTAVGKLRKDLPDVPTDARVDFPRYTLDEAAAVCHYYLRYAYRSSCSQYSGCVDIDRHKLYHTETHGS